MYLYTVLGMQKAALYALSSGQMSTLLIPLYSKIVHEGGRGVKKSKKLSTWFKPKELYTHMRKCNSPKNLLFKNKLMFIIFKC